MDAKSIITRIPRGVDIWPQLKEGGSNADFGDNNGNELYSENGSDENNGEADDAGGEGANSSFEGKNTNVNGRNTKPNSNNDSKTTKWQPFKHKSSDNCLSHYQKSLSANLEKSVAIEQILAICLASPIKKRRPREEQVAVERTLTSEN